MDWHGIRSTRGIAPRQKRLNRVLPRGAFFFPRVRTPCGHGAQVIVEGREEQSDGGEKNKETQHHPKPTNTTTKGPQAVSPPSCSLSSVQGETCETKKSV